MSPVLNAQPTLLPFSGAGLRRAMFRRLVAEWTVDGELWLPMAVARELWRATRYNITYH